MNSIIHIQVANVYLALVAKNLDMEMGDVSVTRNILVLKTRIQNSYHIFKNHQRVTFVPDMTG
jgi:hypothetical protein